MFLKLLNFIPNGILFSTEVKNLNLISIGVCINFFNFILINFIFLKHTNIFVYFYQKILFFVCGCIIQLFEKIFIISIKLSVKYYFEIIDNKCYMYIFVVTVVDFCDFKFF